MVVVVSLSTVVPRVMIKIKREKESRKGQEKKKRLRGT